MLAMAVKQASKGRTTTIHVQDPKASPRNWDLLVVPEHDRVRGPNVVVTQGAPHRVTQLKLRSGAEALRQEYEHLPSPRVDRKRAVQGKSVSARVDLGGRRRLKKKTQTHSGMNYLQYAMRLIKHVSLIL